MTTQDVGEVFEELYGKKYSTSQVSRMFDYARKEAEEWLVRPLESYYPILYIDALYASTRRGDSCSKEAYFSVLAVKSDKTREVLGIYNNPHESASFWDEILQNLRDSGVHKVGLVVRGALPNVEAGLILLYGVATEMSCYNYPITAFVHEQQHFRWD